MMMEVEMHTLTVHEFMRHRHNFMRHTLSRIGYLDSLA
jgi:hypothetical protein